MRNNSMGSQIHEKFFFEWEFCSYGNSIQASNPGCVYIVTIEKINSDGANRLDFFKTYRNCIVFMEILVFFRQS